MKLRFFALMTILLLAMTACSDLSLPSSPSSSASPTATVPANVIQFTVPAYTVSLPPGRKVPGTQLEYVGQDRDAYMVKINGTETTKRRGDSFIWNGVLARGVFAKYNLRLTTAVLGELPVAGMVDLMILNPELQQAELPNDLSNYLTFNNVVVGHSVNVGETIPGTTAVYEGMVDQQGTQMAQITGANSFSTLATGDSVVWNGKVRENVYVRYTLRVATISADTLRLVGTASLWIDPRTQQ